MINFQLQKFSYVKTVHSYFSPFHFSFHHSSKSKTSDADGGCI